MRKLLFLSLILFTACSSEKTKESSTIEAEEGPTSEDQSPREPVSFVRPAIDLPNSALADLNRVKKKHKNIPYFTQTQDGNLFLTSNKKIAPSDLQDVKKLKGILFGLSNGKGDTLLLNQYQKIGNPGVFADGFVEICKNGQYSFYDYINDNLFNEYFDVLYPSNILGHLAIGKRNNTFYKIYSDGSIKEIKDPSFFPSYKSITKQLQFDVQSDEFGLWISTELFFTEYKDESSAGLYVTPSFIHVLGIIQPFVSDVTLKGSFFGTEKLKTTKVAHRPRNKDTRSMVVAFMEQGLDGRGWMNEQEHVITTDSKNNVKHKRKLNNTSDYNTQNLCKDCLPHGFRFINDSLLEVRYWVFADNEFAKKGMDSLFVAMTQFSYFDINRDGKITPLHEGSLFPMASLISLDKNMLKGCFYKNANHYSSILSYPVLEDFQDYETDDNDAWALEFNHLTASDIRFMINEIYARHGYIFTDKWLNNYYRSRKWYKPVSRNADKKITPLERQNIYFLETIEKQLRQNERDQLKPTRRILVWAG